MLLSYDVARAELELVDVGGHVALFRRDRHAVALLNQSAADLARALLAEDCDADDAPALLAELRKAGFLDRPGSARLAVQAQDAVAPRGDDVPVLGVYRLGRGRRVRLAVAAPALGALLAATLRPLRTEADGRVGTAIAVTGAPPGLSVWRDGVAIARNLDAADARRVALQTMLMAVHEEGAMAAILHASTVVVGGRAVVLAGASGSGKSTLALALAAQGAAYMADDFTGLGHSGQVVCGFPVAVSVKSGSSPVVAGRFPGLRDCPAHEVGDRTVRYLDVGPMTPPPAEAAVGALLFPRFTADAPLNVERLSPEAALGRLLASGSEVVGWPRSLRPVAELVNRVPAWSLSFGCIDQAITAIETRVGPAHGEAMAS